MHHLTFICFLEEETNPPLNLGLSRTQGYSLATSTGNYLHYLTKTSYLWIKRFFLFLGAPQCSMVQYLYSLPDKAQNYAHTHLSHGNGLLCRYVCHNNLTDHVRNVKEDFCFESNNLNCHSYLALWIKTLVKI